MQAHGLRRPVYCVFIAPADRRKGARPTTSNDRAVEYTADDGENWDKLPDGLSPVTGKLPARCLVLGSLDMLDDECVNLLDYADGVDSKKPIRFYPSRSTMCAARTDTRNAPDQMKSSSRGVIAVGKLVAPYCVSVR